jgi:hypothetical protein
LEIGYVDGWIVALKQVAKKFANRICGWLDCDI